MQNNLNNQIISLKRGVLAHSEVTPAEKNRALGTITKSCSNLATQGFQKDDKHKKAKEYRKMTIALKERAGEIGLHTHAFMRFFW